MPAGRLRFDNMDNYTSRQEETEWHRVIFHNSTAKIVGEHLKAVRMQQ